MKNFSDIISLFKSVPSVDGSLVVDKDGLTLASSFTEETNLALSPALHTLINTLYRGLSQMGEDANQILIVQDERIIIAQPVSDVILFIYSQKANLDLLQSRIGDATSILEDITKSESLNS